MLYLTFEEKSSYKYAVLSTANPDLIKQFWLPDVYQDALIIDQPMNKMKAKEKQEFWPVLLDFLKQAEVEVLLVPNAGWFKWLTKVKRTKDQMGVIHEAHGLQIMMAPQFTNRHFRPEPWERELGVFQKAMAALQYGTEVFKTVNVTKHLVPNSEILRQYLYELSKLEYITCDVETHSLNPMLAGIYTIAFSTDADSATAFFIDHDPDCLNVLEEFFIDYQGSIIWHNSSYDVSVIVATLFMEEPGDLTGMLYGLEVMFDGKAHCSQNMAYLAVNSCAGNEIGLKTLAQPVYGDWGDDAVKDVTTFAKTDLLQYNGVDTAATWYVWHEYYPRAEADNQLEVYDLWLTWKRNLIQGQLTGLPINMEQVLEVENELTAMRDTALLDLQVNPIVIKFNKMIRELKATEYNNTRKRARKTPDEIDYEFLPSSSQQVAQLLYDYLQLPVLKKTKSGAPSVSGKVLESLPNHTQNSNILKVLANISDYKDSAKMLSTYIKPFKRAVWSDNFQTHMVHASYKQGGTQSGRLSSSSPNLQNIPNKGVLGKLITSCIQAPKGWKWTGLDFAALEDKISAKQTKDPNKMKVYLAYTEYELVIDGTIHHITSDDIIDYDGKEYTGRQLYALIHDSDSLL